MASKLFGSITAKHKSSSSDLIAHIPSFSASEHHTWRVSLAITIAFSCLFTAYSVRILCKRSAILIKNTRGSLTMSSSNLRSCIKSSSLSLALTSVSSIPLRRRRMTSFICPTRLTCDTKLYTLSPNSSRNSSSVHSVSSSISCKTHAHTASRLFDPVPGKFAASIFALSTQCRMYESPFFLFCPACLRPANATARQTSGSLKIAYLRTSTPCSTRTRPPLVPSMFKPPSPSSSSPMNTARFQTFSQSPTHALTHATLTNAATATSNVAS
mmetsp:Transcript_3176/g.11470  ORF Transcript_3176/g.11470 Transcript_3176/m.11470 type:complete len:270 (+) Transcript_3176:4882-5691(+)